jgi:hypothetical protein
MNRTDLHDRLAKTVQVARNVCGALLATFLLAAGIAAVIGVAAPAMADADATIGPPPVPSNLPGLPDGRVYEQVSPVDKYGNEAGAGTNKNAQELGAENHLALAAADGNAVLFEGTGPMGESTAGYDLWFVARRTSSGWTTRSALPRQERPTPVGGTVVTTENWLDPSSDLTHLLVTGLWTEELPGQCPSANKQLFLSAVAPPAFVSITQPQIANPFLACGASYGEEAIPVGGSPDFGTVYFTTPRTLLPEDASRAPHMFEIDSAFGGGPEPVERVQPWAFYEYSDGVLSEAGVLPDGSLSPWGAVPAASDHGRDVNDHQVSADGSRAFFVSPDPASCTTNVVAGFRGENNCAVDPPELYVRENGEKTVLVSQDTVIRSSDGLPVEAPDGAMGFVDTTSQGNDSFGQSFVYASPDGSQAFFESEDRLTRSAPEGPPRNRAAKMYDFDLNTASLTYLPGVTGEIAASNTDGSAFVFVSPEASAANPELELWSAGPSGGTVTPIAHMMGEIPRVEGHARPDVPVARVSDDGSVVVFMTRLQLPGAFNSGSGLEQIYRYDVPANTLSCVSCAPAGVTPTSSAVMSVLKSYENGRSILPFLVGQRGVSADGDRIFFDTADPLVPQAVNGMRDVYEWENGAVYLISSGKSPENSYFLDSSEDGDDVFFATSEGLVPGDTDGAYDVYDARIPHPGDNPPPSAVPCEGAVCQGPPSVPSPLTPPASATFSGPGNAAPAAEPGQVKPESKPLTRGQKLAQALRACRKRPKTQRPACEKQARKQYGPAKKKDKR